MVELVYKFDEKSTTYVRKSESTAKLSFKLFFVIYICINGH